VRWRKRRHPVDKLPAADRLAVAEREVELSRQRLGETHENVVKPLDRYATGNSFAQIIADGLGYRRRKGARG
jgi:hypothetical protein